MTYLGHPMAFYRLTRDEQIRALAWDRIVRPPKKGGRKKAGEGKVAAKRARLEERLQQIRDRRDV